MDNLAQRRDAFLERLLQSTRGTFELFSIYIGVRLGLYEALARGAQTSTELASRTATVERYVREWLEQQTVVGILEVDDERAEARKRRFTLPAAYVEVLVDQDSLNYLAPLPRLVAGAVHPLDAVLEAYRSGGGVAYADYGVDVREGQAGGRLSLLLLIGTFIGIRQQVLTEEAYLSRTYGDVYRAYASRVGRFVPGVGKLR